MGYELTGKIKVIQEPQTFASGFTKREMAVTVEDGKYPQDISLECLQDKVSLLDNLTEGQEVKVMFDIRGREYNGNHFNNLVAWKIDSNAAQAGQPADQPPQAELPAATDDGIPF